MNALTVPLRNLVRRPMRSILTALGVAVAIAGLVAMTGLAEGVQKALESGIGEAGADLVVAQRGAFTLVGGAIPEELGARLRGVPGVEAVAGALIQVAVADREANVFVIGWPPDAFLWRNVVLQAGRFPASDARWETVIGETLAATLGKRVGDEIELHTQRFRVVGIAHFASALNRGAALVPLAGAQEVFNRAGTLTLLQVRLARPLDGPRVAAARAGLAARAPADAVYDTAELAGDLRLVAIVRAIADAMSIVVLAMAALAVANTMLMAIGERTFEIGVLAAIGWSARRVLGLVAIEAMLLAALGGVVGIGGGLAAMHAVSRLPVASGYLQPFWTWVLIGKALAAALGVGALGALYPAWRATRLDPADALHRL